MEAIYTAELETVAVSVPAGATDEQISAEIDQKVSTAVNSAVTQLSNEGKLTNPQSSVKTETTVKKIDENKGGLSEAELAGVIVGSVLGGLAVLIAIGYVVMTYSRKSDTSDDVSVELEIASPSGKPQGPVVVQNPYHPSVVNNGAQQHAPQLQVHSGYTAPVALPVQATQVRLDNL